MNKKFNTLQIVRALAAILVIFHHITNHYNQFNIPIWQSLKNGFCGVDFFFILSGFVIAYTGTKHIRHPNKWFFFMGKRLSRIYIIYWIFLLIPITIIFLTAPQFIKNPEIFKSLDIFKTIFLFFGHPVISQVTWSLSHEIYFYFIFSLLILSKKFNILIAVILFGTVLNTITLILNINFIHSDLLSNGIFNPLNLEFLMGYSIFYLFKYFKGKRSIFILISSLIIWSIIFSFFNVSLAFHVRLYTFGIPIFLIILSLVSIESKWNLKYPNILVQLGESSFIIYLIHSPILSFWDKNFVLKTSYSLITKYFLTGFGVLAILGLSLFLHYFAEKPIYSALKSRIARV